MHIAVTENNRQQLGNLDLSSHNYPYKILFNKSFEEVSWYQRVNGLIKEFWMFSPNIIVIYGYNDVSLIVLMLLSKLLGVKVIVGIDSTEYDKRRVWFKELLKKMLISFCDAAYTYGTLSANYAMKLGMKKEKVYLMCQATDVNKIVELHRKTENSRAILKNQLQFKAYNFVYVGRLSSEKNLLSLLKAFSHLKCENRNAQDWGLIIVGDGDQKTIIKDFILNNRIPDVFLVGGKSWDEVPTYYALADVFVLPSISEPWGLVVNEAMICGLPVLVSEKCGAAHDLVVHGKNGFVFNPYNTDELIKYMEKFINSEIDIEGMKKCSKEIISEYSPENAAGQMMKGIKSVLKLS